jgi:hypothetical protein
MLTQWLTSHPEWLVIGAVVIPSVVWAIIEHGTLETCRRVSTRRR